MRQRGLFVDRYNNETADTRDVVTQKPPTPRHYDIYHIEIINRTPWPIEHIDSTVEWGRVKTKPPTVYSWRSNNDMAIQTGYFAGFDGVFRFLLKQNDGTRTRFNLLINLQYWTGDMEARVSWQSDDVFNYKVEYNQRLKQLYVRVSLSDLNDLPSSYSMVITSDPQPWRLDSGDPNQQRNRWHEFTNRVFDELRRGYFAFVVINGDVTEFGKTDQWRSFVEQTNKINYGPVLWGLGNHDYENNVGDCASAEGLWSVNGCARFMVHNMQNLHEKSQNLIPEFSYDPESLAYAWSYGKFRFVQANNYPTYTVTLDSWVAGTVVVKSSVSWIKDQFDLYPEKMFILNMHQWRETAMREFMNSPRVAYIFVGHTHVPAVRCENGVKIYDSGALFKGQYYRLDITDDCVKIRIFPQNDIVHDACNSTILTDKCHITQNQTIL